MRLDDAYANAAYIENAETYPPRWEAAAKGFRDRLGSRAELGLPYGTGERQAYDLFHPEGEAKGAVIFIHGGYWLKFDRSFWSHLAAGPLACGWAVAMPSYDLCPTVSIADITRQVSAAVQSVATRIRGPVTVTGHSAGGHLAARMLDKSVMPGPIAGRFRAIVPISPLSDLRPLIETSMNADFKLDVRAAEAESPVLMTDRHAAKVTVWVGEQERPAFLDQARWLAEAWRADHVIAPARHHFDVIDDLERPESKLVATLTGGT